MNFLAIESSTDTLSLAASHSEKTWYMESPGGAMSSRILVPECLKGLAHLGLRMQDLDAIVYGRGPGSFTGLRTACSVAQGFAYPSNTPCLGMDTLLTMAQTAHALGHDANAFFCAIDARMGQLYVASYERVEGHWHALQAPTLVDPQEAAPPKAWSSLESENPFLLVCNTSGATHEKLLATLAQQSLQHQTLVTTPRADALLALAHQAYALKDSNSWSLGTWGLPTPLYIRDRVAQTTLERKTAKEVSIASTP
jgi:tRNA threonylcarbamoyladenosine biosynthesis protein TsaB